VLCSCSDTDYIDTNCSDMEKPITDRIFHDLDQWLKKMRCNGLYEKGITLEQFPDIEVGYLSSDIPAGTEYHEVFIRIENEEDCMEDQKDGRIKIKFKDNTWMEGYLKDEIPHGFCRYFNAKNRLTFIGIHTNGKPTGTCWKIIEGGGCLVGVVDLEGKLSGPNLAYIYPDFTTALVGEFVDGDMVSAQHCTVTGNILESGCIMAPTFSERKGLVFKREISNNNFVTLSPTLKDPYETNTIKVRSSKVPGASEGIFARSDVLKNTVLAFYNGIKLPFDYIEEDTWEANAYKIFDPSNQPDGALDILEKHQSTAGYSASLAHKTNHSFDSNSQFLLYDHPRWGLVPCIASTRDIVACEEIFVRYGYELDNCPDWYAEEWNKGCFEVLAARGAYFTVDDVNDEQSSIESNNE